MVERRRGLTAEERLAERRRDLARLRKERMLRELAGPRWAKMVRILPAFFEREGTLAARRLCVDRAKVMEALREEGVFALDTAMRLAHGSGFLSSGDVQVYLQREEPLDRLASLGLIASEAFPDTVVVRPWAGPERLLAVVVDKMPAYRTLESGYQVITEERLRRELIGAVGARADLFALLDRPPRADVA